MTEIQLDLTIAEADADAERLDELTRRLMNDLRDLGTETVERPAGGLAPDGAKGDAFTLGALALVAIPAVLPPIVAFLQAWALRDKTRSVKIKTPAGLEIEFTPEKRFTEEELLALVDKLTAKKAEK